MTTRNYSSSVISPLGSQVSGSPCSQWHAATQHGFAYVRWLWHPRPDIFVDILDKDALLAFLMVDVSTYDAMLCSWIVLSGGNNSKSNNCGI